MIQPEHFVFRSMCQHDPVAATVSTTSGPAIQCPACNVYIEDRNRQHRSGLCVECFDRGLIWAAREALRKRSGNPFHPRPSA